MIALSNRERKTVSVLQAEIKESLNPLCDDRKKTLSPSLSLRCHFAIYCVAFWQVFNTLLADVACSHSHTPGPESKAAASCFSSAISSPLSYLLLPAQGRGISSCRFSCRYHPGVFHSPTGQPCISDWYLRSRALCRMLCRMPLETPLAQMSGRR